ncbi:hypothetical protein ACFY1J_20810 [Streptomyces sp. NPDC001406]
MRAHLGDRLVIEGSDAHIRRPERDERRTRNVGGQLDALCPAIHQRHHGR